MDNLQKAREQINNVDREMARLFEARMDAVQLVAMHKIENNLPIDAIYLDIDYMERYKDFTIDEKRFPNKEVLTLWKKPS